MAEEMTDPTTDWLARHAWDDLPVLPRHRIGFRVLAPAERDAHAAALAMNRLLGFTCGCLYDDRFTDHAYRQVTARDDSPEYLREVRKWLFERGVPFRTVVRVHHYYGETVETTWKLLVRYWPLFYSGFRDDAVVTDRTFAWALSFCHEGPWTFGRYACRPPAGANDHQAAGGDPSE
jgi:hypothetical protein